MDWQSSIPLENLHNVCGNRLIPNLEYAEANRSVKVIFVCRKPCVRSQFKVREVNPTDEV